MKYSTTTPTTFTTASVVLLSLICSPFLLPSVTADQRALSAALNLISNQIQDAGMMPSAKAGGSSVGAGAGAGAGVGSKTKNGRKARGSRGATNEKQGNLRRLKKSGGIFGSGSKGKGQGPETCCEFTEAILQLDVQCHAAAAAIDAEAICDGVDFPSLDITTTTSSSRSSRSSGKGSSGDDPVDQFEDAQDVFVEFIGDFEDFFEDCILAYNSEEDPIDENGDTNREALFAFNTFSFGGYCLGDTGLFDNDDVYVGLGLEDGDTLDDIEFNDGDILSIPTAQPTADAGR